MMGNTSICNFPGENRALPLVVNMTPDFYNFFRNALEILGLKSWGLLTLCVFTVDVASVGRFPIENGQT